MLEKKNSILVKLLSLDDLFFKRKIISVQYNKKAVSVNDAKHNYALDMPQQ